MTNNNESPIQKIARETGRTEAQVHDELRRKALDDEQKLYVVDRKDIKLIIELHSKWIHGYEGGVRANLSEANLRWADLNNADLRGADLRGADLRWADLRWESLSKADLRGANLRGADLRGADLRGANLSDADLDFSAWPLDCRSFGAKAGKRLFSQLFKHLVMLDVSEAEKEVMECMTSLRQMDAANWFNKFRNDVKKTPS